MLVAAGLWLLSRLWALLLLVVISALVAAALAPVVDWLDRHGLPRALAVLLVFVAGFADMVPLVGVYLIVMPSGLAALSVSPATAIILRASSPEPDAAPIGARRRTEAPRLP